ncbi:MAG: helix-turn-helix domain-containing protein [Marvinbryantia sp.]|uniref:helix-turn-helix domain-containing protein n=1 Tax=Marvinbryantia sp. TaxID=2496532 RepID=UPI0025FFC771|nr:helix-turn-helix domain-containing protein [uncultured Marvinbryantia sp.]
MDRNLIAGTAHELYGQGKSPKQIAAVLHTSVQTAYELTRDIPKGELNDNGLTSKLQVMADFPVRWIDAVNPIRRYYGHEPMELHFDQ